ncbi:FbpB family small basic protein [Salipaludibacillus daqingensis]|nr:FbpB family small basic protein [Salipaludibacillus daqingensis]
MRKKLKQRYEDLYKQNITSLMKDEKEIEKIEQRIDKKHMDRLGS